MPVLLTNPRMKIEDLLKRALSNPAVVRRLEEQLHKSKSVVSLLFSKESRAEMQRAIDRDRQPRVFGVNARNGGKDVQLYKREGEKSLTSIVIEAIKDAENPFAALILALIIFPISVVLDLIGLVIALVCPLSPFLRPCAGRCLRIGSSLDYSVCHFCASYSPDIWKLVLFYKYFLGKY